MPFPFFHGRAISWQRKVSFLDFFVSFASGIPVAALDNWECSVAASGLATVLADPRIADDVALGNDHGHCSGS